MSLLHKFGHKTLRLLEAERAHNLTVSALRAGLGSSNPQKPDPILLTKIAGLALPGPVGLAAGFDKNAEVPAAMANFGFGWIECGTVTPKPQAGNPKPRLFRLPKDEAVINRMGFNNKGLDVFEQNLRRATRASPACLIGANIGANKDSADRINDYCSALRRLWGLPNWFTINISSPNTPGLRDLQGASALQGLLQQIAQTRQELIQTQSDTPIFLKIAPDLDERQIEDICQATNSFGLSGLIISNTTLARPSSLRSRHKFQSGGLSGQPLFEVSTQVLRLFYEASKGKIPLIGVGGISNTEQAWQKIKAGASAIQLYSALAYKGPFLAEKIHKELAEKMRALGISSIHDIIGTD